MIQQKMVKIQTKIMMHLLTLGVMKNTMSTTENPKTSLKQTKTKKIKYANTENKKTILKMHLMVPQQ